MERYSEMSFIVDQKKICAKYGSEFFLSPFDSIVGIALQTFDKSMLPINGLRHSINNKTTTGWYVWVGEYSLAEDFFQPIHTEHLLEIYPKIINYLGLSPGWRFLFDDKYEDVWFDEKLLF